MSSPKCQRDPLEQPKVEWVNTWITEGQELLVRARALRAWELTEVSVGVERFDARENDKPELGEPALRVPFGVSSAGR